MKKRLLNEHATRKFMKLAGLQPLSENFLTATLEEEELSEEAHLEDEEGDLEPADEAPLDELPPEEPMEVGDEGGVDVHSLVDAIAAAIQQETGVSVDVEGDHAGEEPELDLGEPELDEPLDDEESLGDDAPADDLELGEMAHNEGEMEEDLYEMAHNEGEEEDLAEMAHNEGEEDIDEGYLNEVTRRVAEKLLEMSKKNK